MDTNFDANEIIDSLGGTSAVANICEVTDQAVSQWRANDIPAARLMYLKVIRPDVFEKLGSSSTAKRKKAA